MNCIKLIKSVIAVLAVAFTTGCSDYITSTDSSSNTSASVSAPVKHAGTMEVYCRLKPFKSVTIDRENTTLERFYSVRVNEESNDINDTYQASVCGKISISGDSEVSTQTLNCINTGFDVSSITIENKSSELLDLHVTVTGKLKPIDTK
ncbi:MAG: hypothetical protein HGGPFJEG_02918 [Ignavibacteria bacterium]|nr:hypothetical protein [Ignavibacteria bacterium]